MFVKLLQRLRLCTRTTNDTAKKY